MEKRCFENIGKQISLLGFGCMRLPKLYEDKQDIDEKAAQELIDYAMEQGVNYYDTAYPYHDGMSETFIGKALKKYDRNSFYLASKLPMWEIKKEEDVSRYFEEQLQKCQVEYFDFYLMHALNQERFEQDKELRVYEILSEYKRQGKIKHLGFSFHDTPDVLEQNIDNYPWDFIQLQINYLDWELQNSKYMYELAETRAIPIVVMEPVRGGALASLNDTAAAMLKKQQEDVSIASWAIRYVASLPGVMTVLSGMSDLAQVKDNVGTMNNFKPLDEGERKVLNEALKMYKASGTIPCTGCRYCMECPFGVDIPILIGAYNQYKVDGNAFQFGGAYKALGADKQPDKCTSCKKCIKQCPQSIDIPEVLKEVKAAIQKAEEQED